MNNIKVLIFYRFVTWIVGINKLTEITSHFLEKLILGNTFFESLKVRILDECMNYTFYEFESCT